ncbi:hypothetical protein Emed_004877 [Eimeria media]
MLADRTDSSPELVDNSSSSNSSSNSSSSSSSGKMDPAAMFVLVAVGLMASFALSGYLIDRYRMQEAKQTYQAFSSHAHAVAH